MFLEYRNNPLIFPKTRDINVANYLNFRGLDGRSINPTLSSIVTDVLLEGSWLEKSCVLDFSDCNISCDDINLIFERLKGRVLKKLDFTNCQLSDEKILKITHALLNNTRPFDIRVYGGYYPDTVTLARSAEIKLDKNNITDESSLSIATCIERMKVDISVTWNFIGCTGARALTKAWVGLGKQVIDLSYNYLFNYGAKFIAEELQHNPGQVTWLELVGNGIGLDGDKDLAMKVPLQVQNIWHRTEDDPNLDEFTSPWKFTKGVALIPVKIVIAIPMLFIEHLLPYPRPPEKIKGCLTPRRLN